MADDAVDQWEYRAVRPPREATKKESRDPTDQLNDLAGEGWRLVETVEYVGGGTKYLVFERPSRSDDSADDDSVVATDDDTRERRNRD